MRAVGSFLVALTEVGYWMVKESEASLEGAMGFIEVAALSMLEG